MRLRRRAAGLAFGAVILFVIGTNAQAGWLFVLAALLLGTVLAGIVVPLVALRGLAVELSAPAESHQGADTRVQLTVTNRGRAVRWGLVASDEHVGGATAYIGSARPRESVEVRTGRGAAPRGGGGAGGGGPPRVGGPPPAGFEFRPPAPSGVADPRRRLPADATTLVLPRVVPLGA